MKFKKIKVITSSLLITSTLITSVYAESVQELEDKQKNIESNIDEANDKIEQKQQSIDEINAQIQQLDAELDVAVKELADINEQLATVTEELNQANDALVEKTLEKEAQQETLEQRVRYMYEYGQTSYLDTLLDSTSFVDLINRVEYLNVIHEYDQNMYDQLEQQEKDIQELVETIDAKKTETEVLQKSATTKRDELQANVTQKEALNAQISSDINLLEQQIAEQEQASADIEKMIQDEIKRQEELARQNSSQSINTTYTGGKLMWPSDTSSISSTFGYRIHPITGVNKLHAGIDIPVGVGSNVYSAESGTVLTAGWVQGYGNCVIIMHDNGLTTLYGHLSSINVSVGQRVNRGDLIAYSGNSGNSTGPHLHFEVRVGGSPVDPMPYLQ